jgi:hypothetical protein
VPALERDLSQVKRLVLIGEVCGVEKFEDDYDFGTSERKENWDSRAGLRRLRSRSATNEAIGNPTGPLVPKSSSFSTSVSGAQQIGRIAYDNLKNLLYL